MQTVVVTSGDRTKHPEIPPEPRRFAHRYVAKSTEGFDSQASNFLVYVRCLGHSDPPYLLLAPSGTDQLDEVQMSDFCQVVTSATGIAVEVVRP